MEFSLTRKFTGFFIISLISVGLVFTTVFLTKNKINLKNIIIRPDTSQVLSTQAVMVEKVSVFENKLDPILSNPTKLIIQSINLKADLAPVGVDKDGVMETPKDWFTAGWYDKGARPGETRNLIINGHYDTNTGAAAIFWNINRLKTDDLIEVIDKYGRIFNYKVLELGYVDLKDPSRLDVLKDEDGKSTLTLITCSGVWQPGYGYNKRLIVKSELVE